MKQKIKKKTNKDLKEVKNYFSGNKHPLRGEHLNKKNKKITYFITLFLLVIIFVSALVVLTGVYYWKWENKFIIKLSQKIPMPVLLVDKKIIWLNDYYKDLTALTKFYDRQSSLEAIPINELKIQTLSKLIEKQLIEQAANEFNITVTEAEIKQETSIIQQNSNGQDINDLTLEIFGWNFEEFTERVIKFDILTSKLNNYLVNNQEIQKDNLEKINNYKNQLDNGTDFDTMANYIGWFNEDEIVDIILDDLKPLSIEQVTSIIETDYGYYIIKLLNKIELDNNQSNYELSQIFVKKYDLAVYLEDQQNQNKVYRFINI